MTKSSKLIRELESLAGSISKWGYPTDQIYDAIHIIKKHDTTMRTLKQSAKEKAAAALLASDAPARGGEDG